MAQAIELTTAKEILLIQQNNALFQENHQRSQNEQLLYIECHKANNEKTQMNNVIM